MFKAHRKHFRTKIALVVLSLIFAQFPSTNASAVTYCLGAAAYPPDLPDCLDPVVEAQKIAQQQAADAAADRKSTRLNSSHT